MKPRPLHRNWSAFGFGCLLLAALSGLALADFDEGRGMESSEPFLRPLKVVSTSGNVRNAQALVGRQAGDTTLNWNGVGDPPMIVLDYGRDVGGIPIFSVTKVSGTPTLRAIYSEGQPFLLPNGDGAAPSGGGVVGGRVGNLSFVGNLGAGDLSRVNDYPLQGAGFIVHRLIQGGERFQAITLAAPGSIT